MSSELHRQHVSSRISHNDCPECRADCERRHVRTAPWTTYEHVRAYLGYVKPRLIALQTDNSIDARQWHREFVRALHRRISLRMPANGRKQCDGYLERLGQFVDRQSLATKRHRANADYLRQFARKGASAL
jgi:hypothetical protein